jgi:hypothetical protein
MTQSDKALIEGIFRDHPDSARVTELIDVRDWESLNELIELNLRREENKPKKGRDRKYYEYCLCWEILDEELEKNE